MKIVHKQKTTRCHTNLRRRSCRVGATTSFASSVEGSIDFRGRALVIPVVSSRDGILAAKVRTVEPKIVRAEGAVGVHDVAVVARDTTVIPDAVARLAPDVMAERAKAGVELLENDGLGLDLADLLGDNPLGHLLNDEKALLNDLNALAAADKLLVLLDDDLLLDGATEVIRAVEVIEAIERRDAHPVVEGDGRAMGAGVCTSSQSPDLGQRLSHDTDDHSRGSEDKGKFGEHFKK